jgi:hypothetical protein
VLSNAGILFVRVSCRISIAVASLPFNRFDFYYAHFRFCSSRTCFSLFFSPLKFPIFQSPLHLKELLLKAFQDLEDAAFQLSIPVHTWFLTRVLFVLAADKLESAIFQMKISLPPGS